MLTGAKAGRRAGSLRLLAARTRQPGTLRSLCDNGSPEFTDFFKLDPSDTSIFGHPRVQSTRLQAASRRIVEQFMIYGTMEQALLEQEASKDFGDMQPPSTSLEGPELVDVNRSTLENLDDDTAQAAKRFLFNSYDLPQSESLQEFVDRIDTMPSQREETQTMFVQKLNYLLKSTEPGFLRELAKLLLHADTPAVSTLVRLVLELNARRYFKPAQVVLDSLMMSRVPLGLGMLAAALDLATKSGNEGLFSNYAQLLPLPFDSLPPPLTLSSVPSYRPDLPFVREKVVKARFFDPRAPIPVTSESKHLFYKLARGFQKFRKPQHLDRVMWWAYQNQALTDPLVTVNMRAATMWSDPVRAKWTWDSAMEQQVPVSLQFLKAAGKQACLKSQLAAYGSKTTTISS